MNLLSLLSLATLKPPSGLDRAAHANLEPLDDAAAPTFAGLLTQARVEPVNVLPAARVDPGVAAPAVRSTEASATTATVAVAMVPRYEPDTDDAPLPPQEYASGDALPLTHAESPTVAANIVVDSGAAPTPTAPPGIKEHSAADPRPRPSASAERL